MTPNQIDLGSTAVMDDTLPEFPDAGGTVQTELEDGSVEIQFGPDEPEVSELAGAPHEANLAEYLADDQLNSIGMDVLDLIASDILTRKDWEDQYKEGLNYLGMKDENVERPWKGSCGLFHPVIVEGALRFQANCVMEIFPASGPVRTEIIGEITPAKQAQADRLQSAFNHLLTITMDDYRPETEKLLWALAICGSGFRKICYDPILGRISATYVPAQDFLLPYGTTSLQSAPRYTHVMRKPVNEIRKLQSAGTYVNYDELLAEFPQQTELEQKLDKLNNTASNLTNYDMVTVYECHIDLDLPGLEDKNDDEPTGIALPYIVHVTKESRKVLGIYRNWKESDKRRRKKLWFVKYDYVPGMDAYGMGLIQLIGQQAKAATAILRMLIDAGILSNFQGGFVANDIRWKGDESPLTPGEWKRLEVNMTALKDGFLPLPYKEPSAVLLQLLQMIVEDARRMASIADADIGNVNGQAPVGTTLAIMERSLKVVSAIQARAYYSQGEEFRIIMRVLREDCADADEQVVDLADLDGINVVPVADPNAATNSQRVMQYQAALQLSTTAPQNYNLKALHRAFLVALGIKDANVIIPDDSEVPPLDPVSEIQHLMTGKAVKPGLQQPHADHIKVLQNFLADPGNQAIIGQNPQGAQIMGAFHACISGHRAFDYRRQIEKSLGVPLPSPDSPLPPDTQTYLAKALADASDQVLGEDQAKAQQQQAQQQAQDPVMQQQLAQTQIEKDKLALEGQKLAYQQQKDAADRASKENLEKLRIDSQSQQAQAQLTAKQTTDHHSTLLDVQSARIDNQRVMVEMQQAQADLSKTRAEAQKTLVEVQEVMAQTAKLRAEISDIEDRIAKGANAPRPQGPPTEGN